MKMTIGFIFNRKNKPNKQGLFSIDMRIQLRGEKYPKYIVIANIKENEWSVKNKRVKLRKDAGRINGLMVEQEKRAWKYFHQMVDNEKDFTLSKLIKHLKGREYESFSSFISYQIKSNHKSSASTIESHISAMKKLTEFGGDVSFRDLDYEFFLRFESFLIKAKNKKNPSKGLSKNYISVILGYVGGYLKKAKKMGLIEGNPLEDFNTVPKRKSPIWLEYPDEVMKIEELDVSERKEKVEVYKDMVLFCVYTGLRIGDIIGDKRTKENFLAVEHLVKEEKGYRLKKQPNKTKKSSGIWVNLPLWVLYDGKPQAIIKKYIEGKEKQDRVFPKVTSNTIGTFLRGFCEELNIDKKIDVHSLRHSFAMGLLNHYKIRLSAVQKALGHSSIASTQIYARLSDKGLDDELGG